MKYIVIIGLYMNILHSMNIQETVALITDKAKSPIDLYLQIEETKKAYNNVSLFQKSHCCDKASEYVNQLELLKKKKNQSKVNQPNFYIDVSTYPILINNKSNKHTLSLDNSLAPKNEKSLLIKGFSQVNYYTWQSLTSMKLCNTGLCILPLQKIIHFCSNLEELDVSNNNITAITYASLNPIHNKRNVTLDLNLSYNKLETVDLDSLFELCPYISNIDMSYNPKLKNIILEKEVVWKENKSICPSPAWNCLLPTIKIHNTQLDEEQKKKIKKAYIKAMMNARTEVYEGYGIGICGPCSWAALLLNVLLFGNHIVSNIELDGLITGLAATIGGTGGGFILGALIGRYIRPQSTVDAMAARADEHIIVHETA